MSCLLRERSGGGGGGRKLLNRLFALAVNTDINCASKESNGPSPNISSDIYQSLDDVEHDAEKRC